MSKIGQLASDHHQSRLDHGRAGRSGLDACGCPRPMVLHGAADVGGATAVGGGRLGR
jgi:hypothetical protein